jgi:imidazoleglycerol-phosphate dehydratase
MKNDPVSLSLNLYGSGQSRVHSSIPFLDHMFDAFAKHGHFDLSLDASPGPTQQRVRQLGAFLGQQITENLGARRSINGRGSFFLPMDETLSYVSLDLLSRPSFSYQVHWVHTGLGRLNALFVEDFFRAVSQEGKFQLTMELRYGRQPHHVAESLFKGFAKALSLAIEKN